MTFAPTLYGVARKPHRSTTLSHREWAEDAVLRQTCGVPEEVEFATKPQIALEQMRAACRAGVTPGVVLADAAYGDAEPAKYWLATAPADALVADGERVGKICDAVKLDLSPDATLLAPFQVLLHQVQDGFGLIAHGQFAQPVGKRMIIGIEFGNVPGLGRKPWGASGSIR